MKRALEAAFALARTLPASRIEAIASNLASGASDSKVSASVSSSEARQAVDEYLDAIEGEGISREVAAAILMSSGHAHRATSKEQDIELVVTGPSTPFVATRRTEQVLMDLIAHAKGELFLVSFVAGDWKRIIEALVEAHARGVAIRVLMEASKTDGGSLERDQSKELVRAVPGAKIYRWTEKDAEHADGKIHAKIALADDDMAFISSANFTGYAMEKNFEVGVLVREGSLSKDLHRHLHGLIDLRTISEVG